MNVNAVLERLKAVRPKLIWTVVIAIVVLVAAIFAARAWRATDTGAGFLSRYPGYLEVAAGSETGFPWWMQWQHALNFFLMVLIIRAGYLVHSQRRPDAYWTKNKPGKNGQAPKISIYLWLHLLMDAIWVPNGIIFGVLLAVTGAWRKIVPTSWDIFPNAVSAGVQYLSLDWPVNEPFVAYNSLQVLAYFVTVFVAAPLAAITGIRMARWWQSSWKASNWYPVQLARKIHYPVMIYFVAFIIGHVGLVFATDMRLNLNAMYSWQDQPTTNWWGLIVFLGVLIVVIAGWVAARPIFMAPVASMTGRISSR